MADRTQGITAALQRVPSVDVLIIDDADVTADLTARGIRRAAPSAKIVRFRDATKALHFVFLAEPGPALVLFKLGDPLHAGLHVLERLRSTPSTSSIPVIILTSTRDPAAIKANQALGANCLIASPETPEDHCAQVQAAVERWLTTK